MAKASFTEDQAVASAATELAQELVEVYAMSLWVAEDEGLTTAGYQYLAGKCDGMREALETLIGGPYRLPRFNTIINGNKLVAINILGEGLYRSFVGGTLSYYILKTDSNVLSPATNNVVDRAWVWLDPFKQDTY